MNHWTVTAVDFGVDAFKEVVTVSVQFERAGAAFSDDATEAIVYAGMDLATAPSVRRQWLERVGDNIGPNELREICHPTTQ